jgi:asparagine synthase (glutamine-hydrolysing)
MSCSVALWDGRIDARDDLCRALGVPPSMSDVDLVAHAFDRWGDDAPAHIVGDFALAVWDEGRRRLVLARDRFGVRPLYFVRDGLKPVPHFSTDLATLVTKGEALDETAINDFLLFGQGRDPAKTTYSRIERVPPAHVAIFDERGMRMQRYWSVPVADVPRKTGDAVEEFRVIFDQAVVDRAADRVAISLSGGVDSTAVAATLVRVRPGTASAVTAGYEHLVRDDDPPSAARAANALGIPWHFLASDRYTLFERWDDPHCRGLEPVDTPLRAAFIDLMRLLGERAPVILTGQGGDAVLYASHGYFIDLLRRGRVDRVVAEGLRYALTRRKLPPLLFRSHLLRALHLRSDVPPYPAWMRADLRDRWHDVWSWRRQAMHPWRPEAASLVQQPDWPNAFQSYDAAWTGVDAHVTTPFFDARVVEFLFSLPPMPHFADKDIVRRAMAGRLPDEIRLRPKKALGVDPAEVLLRQEIEKWLPFLHRPEMAPYVDPRILTESVHSAMREARPLHQEIKALCLAVWLAYR